MALINRLAGTKEDVEPIPVFPFFSAITLLGIGDIASIEEARLFAGVRPSELADFQKIADAANTNAVSRWRLLSKLLCLGARHRDESRPAGSQYITPREFALYYDITLPGNN